MSKELLIKIARCKNVQKYVGGKGMQNNPCENIVEYQEKTKIISDKKDFQLPEPWRGDIKNAKILFVGSNPSISKVAKGYPLHSSTDKEIEDHFTDCFDNIDEGIYLPGNFYKNGNRKPVKYWEGVKERACELLDKEKEKVKAGKDYALTEVVHCKSKGGAYVEQVMEECGRRYLDEILEVSGARVVVCSGAKAKKIIGNFLELKREERNWVEPIKRLGRWFIFLKHLSYRYEDSTFKRLKKEKFNELRNALK
ncbi:MAG: uracil-DNA glycosylase family protein [Thermodesulfobacteriota bacterium]